MVVDFLQTNSILARGASSAWSTLHGHVLGRALEPFGRTPSSPLCGACTAASTRRAAPPASPGCTSASPGSSTRHASVRSRTRSYAVFAETQQAESARARTRKNNNQTPRTPVPLRCCGPPHGVVREPPGPGGPLRYPLPAFLTSMLLLFAARQHVSSPGRENAIWVGNF